MRQGSSDAKLTTQTGAAQDGVAPCCRMCGHSELVAKFDVNHYQICECAQCGLVQLGALLADADYEAIYDDGYFDRGKYIESRAETLEQARRVGLLDRAGVPDGALVLDAGCATGDFVRAAKARFNVWGVDLSEFAVSEARRANPEVADQLFSGSLEALAGLPEVFDAIVLWDVVEHLRYPRSVIASLVERLKPGGVLVLSTPYMDAPIAKLMGRKWAFMTPPEHVCLFGRRHLTTLLTDQGLSAEHWQARGKWVNVGFLTHKLRRQFPSLVPAWLEARMRNVAAMVYVPTGDIQYLTGRLGTG